VGRILQNTEARQGGHRFSEKLDALRRQLIKQKTHAREIPPRTSRACDQVRSHGIGAGCNDYRNPAGRVAKRERDVTADSEQDIDLQTHQIRRHFCQLLGLSAGMPILDGDIPALNQSEIPQAS